MKIVLIRSPKGLRLLLAKLFGVEIKNKSTPVLNFTDIKAKKDRHTTVFLFYFL